MAKTAIEDNVDVIFSGAGLPLDLPSYLTPDSTTKLVPIISSARAAKIICDKDFPLSERTGKWGAQDHVLFQRLLKDMKEEKQQEPFLILSKAYRQADGRSKCRLPHRCRGIRLRDPKELRAKTRVAHGNGRIPYLY